MYTPSSFRVSDHLTISRFIKAHNFGVLFSHHGETPEATHLPFMVETHGNNIKKLIAHFAKANKQWRRIDESKEVLVVFQGPHAYITPSWYEQRETVPTWNYAAVHVRGKAKIIHQKDRLRQMVEELTHFHEQQVDSDWDLQEAASIMETELKAITGIEISVKEIEAKFKFNQNRSEQDQRCVIDHLRKHQGDKSLQDVAEIMEENLKKGSR